MVSKMEDIIIAVDFEDRPIKPVSKTDAHAKSIFHRAFSVILFDDQKKILMQKRAFSKYHCGGLWSNTCCSHPIWEEPLLSAVYRKLEQELGITSVDVHEIGHMRYYYQFDNGLSEFEYDHIFVGYFDGEININTNEVDSIKWMEIEKICEDVVNNPRQFTPWFIQMLPFIKKYTMKDLDD